MASVCVMCKMAKLMEDEAAYERFRDILDRGSAAYDKLLWNGKFMSKSSFSFPPLYCLIAFRDSQIFMTGGKKQDSPTAHNEDSPAPCVRLVIYQPPFQSFDLCHDKHSC